MLAANYCGLAKCSQLYKLTENNWNKLTTHSAMMTWRNSPSGRQW